ncbi:hypothetical protein NDU88_005985 [Pleurodeles waltl]|uniref:Uncharacterized protein n=1 Tax=Pleurodeles waltl TaxID=8319 RepID=A0AAV7NRY9_PLEWA|nr:hypothetical protein NDU88_005985 [Pleurodeles waltl]
MTRMQKEQSKPHGGPEVTGKASTAAGMKVEEGTLTASSAGFFARAQIPHVVMRWALLRALSRAADLKSACFSGARFTLRSAL